MSAETKVCRACHQDRPLEVFEVDSTARDGRRARCKQCISDGRLIRPKKTHRKQSRQTWSVAEADDDVFVVRSYGCDDALVSWSGKDWVCSVCGHQPRAACEHVAAVTRTLPLDLALRLAGQLAPLRRARAAKHRKSIPENRERLSGSALPGSAATPGMPSWTVKPPNVGRLPVP